jgi:hypothetical protein
MQVELQAVSRAAAEVMGTDWLKVFEGTATACGVMSLRPGCVYRLRVRCANSAGWGSWCLPLQVGLSKAGGWGTGTAGTVAELGARHDWQGIGSFSPAQPLA